MANNSLRQRMDAWETSISSFQRLLTAFVAVNLAFVLNTQPVTAQPVADLDTLLLTQFDRSLDADYAKGTATADSRSKLVPGRFGMGVDLESGQRVSFVGNDGNFNLDSGTVEFWIKPHWPGNDTSKHSLFNCRFGTRGYVTVNTIGTGRIGCALSSGEGDAWCWRRAEADITDWKPDQWHHFACTWGDGQLRVFVDGQEGRRQVDDARMPDALPETLSLLAGDAVIDALRISRRRFMADDAQQSIRLALGPLPYRFLDAWLAETTSAREPGRRVLLGQIRIPLVLGSARYQNGFVFHPGETQSVRLNGDYATFQATVGVDPFSPVKDSCSFEVWGDNKRLFDSGPRTAEQPPLPINGNVAHVNELTLKMRPAETSHDSTRGVWANAVVARQGVQAVLPSPTALKPAELDMYRRQVRADVYQFSPPKSHTYFIASKFWEDDLDPEQPPDADQVDAPLKGFAAPNEYEPLNFVVYAVDDLESVRAVVSDLRNGSARITADRIDVRLVLRGLMRDVYTFPPERSTVVSRFLLPQQPVDIPAGTMREFHLIVHVPEDAAPGQYTGTVQIAPANQPSREISVTFEVLPVRLRPLRRKAYGVYYRFPADEADWSQAEPELSDIHAHGATMLKTSLGVRYARENDGVRISCERLERGLKLLQKHDFHGPLPIGTSCEQAAQIISYDPVNDDADDAAREKYYGIIRQGMEELEQVGRRYPAFELLPTHMDEVFGRGRLERYIRLTEAVRQMPSFRVYITLHNDPRRSTDDMMRQCDPFVDVRCYNGHAMDEWIRAGHSFEELRSQLDRSGDEAWIYYNIRGSFFQAEWTRLVNGFYLWLSPLRVHVPWMYYSYTGNPLDDTDGPRLHSHDFAYAVPDPENPNRMIPTRHWEAFREGIDDMRYLETLEDLIAEHGSATVAKEAKQWLDALRTRLRPDPQQLQTVEGESPILQTWAKEWNGADYRTLRRQAAVFIEGIVGRTGAVRKPE